MYEMGGGVFMSDDEEDTRADGASTVPERQPDGSSVTWSMAQKVLGSAAAVLASGAAGWLFSDSLHAKTEANIEQIREQARVEAENALASQRQEERQKLYDTYLATENTQVGKRSQILSLLELTFAKDDPEVAQFVVREREKLGATKQIIEEREAAQAKAIEEQKKQIEDYKKQIEALESQLLAGNGDSAKLQALQAALERRQKEIDRLEEKLAKAEQDLENSQTAVLKSAQVCPSAFDAKGKLRPGVLKAAQPSIKALSPDRR